MNLLFYVLFFRYCECEKTFSYKSSIIVEKDHQKVCKEEKTLETADLEYTTVQGASRGPDEVAFFVSY